MPGKNIEEFHVFIASPGDVAAERQLVREYFEQVNRSAGVTWGARFQLIEYHYDATIGVGRPQALITAQTLERYRATLVLVIVIMAQRFGSPSGAADSGTEEEIRWALAAHEATGTPEVKFFFRDVEQFVAPADLAEITEAVEQWKHVRAFRDEIESGHQIWAQRYRDVAAFGKTLSQDLGLWLHSHDRPWVAAAGSPRPAPADDVDGPPVDYLRSLVRDNQWLDIAGIDSDRAFKLPLEEIYVRLRVISAGVDGEGDNDDAAPFDIQTALERYRRLVVVGDPGSGKSTFLRFIALVLASCLIDGDPARAHERLSLPDPIPVPIFVSCWDLAEHLRKIGGRAKLDAVLDFVVERVTEAGWPLDPDGLRRLLDGDRCILLVDGLDEVPTEHGRHLVSDLIEELVARYPRNRYVVTSRVRAYTGEAQLKEEFARCDIQPFAEAERKAFLSNWVGQLFKVRGDTADASNELDALTTAIETSSIRDLAINPLLLTVIAIVHWNRKRLPEQRVDLYDECVDVLLGQRKQAEQQRASRDLRVLEREDGEKRFSQRIWVRKRFAEISYEILIRSEEEIGHAAAVTLLEPHFRDKDEPRAAAERFLDEQELSSGLLVRRRSQSYRFVHLTFQEYLAAWHLASRVLTSTLATITPHLRDPKWFETLQLLGGALANRSDDDLDKYVDHLVKQAGSTIREQAPVVALCANIVRDTQAVATLDPRTHRRYEDLLRDTLAAFAPTSKVPKQTQLEILEALGTLGASVKEHLISATKSRLLDVRRRALEMLVPHLPDADLFAMTHILSDRSKEPIKTYISALIDRDPIRAGEALLDFARYGEKTLDAVAESERLPLQDYSRPAWPAFIGNILRARHYLAYSHEDLAVRVLTVWRDQREATWMLIDRLAELGNDAALTAVATGHPDREHAWRRTQQGAKDGSAVALSLLARQFENRPGFLELVNQLADAGSVQALSALYDSGDVAGVRSRLIRLAKMNSEEAADVLSRVDFILGPDPDLFGSVAEHASAAAAHALAECVRSWPGLGNHIVRLANAGSESGVIIAALVDPHNKKIRSKLRWLAGAGSAAAIDVLSDWRYPQPEDWSVLSRLAKAGNAAAMAALAGRSDRTDETRKLLVDLANAGSVPAARALAIRWSYHPDSSHLLIRLANAGSEEAVEAAVDVCPTRPETWNAVLRLGDTAMRRYAPRVSYTDLTRLSSKGSTEADDPPQLLIRMAEAGSGPAGQVLLRRWPTHRKTWDSLERLAEVDCAPDIWVELVLQFGDRPSVWTLITHLTDGNIGRIVRDASPQSDGWLLDMPVERGNDAARWAFLERLAAAGSVEAGKIVAWRDWAFATAAEAGVRAFFGGGDKQQGPGSV